MFFAALSIFIVKHLRQNSYNSGSYTELSDIYAAPIYQNATTLHMYILIWLEHECISGTTERKTQHVFNIIFKCSCLQDA